MKARLLDIALRTPWATLLPLLLLVPFSLSGAVRYTLGWSLERGLALGAAALILSAATLGLPDLQRATNRLSAMMTFITAAVLILLTYRLWWNPLFEGLPNTSQGVDVGNHAIIYQRFIGAHPRQYEGFVALYALMYWYEVLIGSHPVAATSIYFGLRFAHYASLLAIPVALALASYPSLARLSGRRRIVLAGLSSLAVQSTVLAALVFPAVQYYQTDGFFSQVAGLFPLLFGWLFFGLCQSADARLVTCAFWLVVQRFTYGLNFGDALATCAALWIWEQSQVKRWWLRGGAVLFVPVAAYVAVQVGEKLWGLRHMQGYFWRHSIAWLLPSQILLSVVLLAAPGVLASAGATLPAESTRMTRYAGLFGLINGGLTVVYFAHDGPQMYYVFKYSLYAVTLVCIAGAGLVSAVIIRLIDIRRSWLLEANAARVLLGGTAVLAVSVIGLLKGHEVYRDYAQERYERIYPPRYEFSHYEPQVGAFIQRVLRSRGALFGGYYDPFWSRMFLTNALRFQFSSQPDYVFNRAFERRERMFDELAGHCYFVWGSLADYPGAIGHGMGIQIATFASRRQECTKVRPRWAEQPIEICATCF